MKSVELSQELRDKLLSVPEEHREEVMDSILRELEGKTLEPINVTTTASDVDSPTASIQWRQREQFREHIPGSRKETRKALSSFGCGGSHFETFISGLKDRRSKKSLDNLRTSTYDLLSYMSEVDLETGKPALTPKSRQLICGDIQSGKSQASESLASSAIDLGCRVVIVVAGTTDKLRDQTQRRFDSDLVSGSDGSILSPTQHGDLITYRRHNSDSRRYWGSTRALVNKHLAEDETNAIVLIVKKNRAILEATHQFLKIIDHWGHLNDKPILVIDDESDAASQNTASDLYDGTPNTIGSPVHKAIVKIVEEFDSHYWGMTATAAASIFLHPKDPLFPSTAHVLEPHEFYLGAFEVFHTNVDQIVKPCIIDDLVLPSRAKQVVPYLKGLVAPPPSLITAMLNHGLSGAIHKMLPRKVMPHGSHHSAMVHICREIRGQREVVRLVKAATTSALRRIDKAESGIEPTIDDAIHRFRENRTALRSSAAAFPDRSDLLALAREVIESSEIRLLNFESDDDLDYDDPEFPDNIIVIGGNLLSRGLTIEGLRTTYFVHQPKDIVNDTTLQNARWFGPLKEDKDLLSIHLTANLHHRFEAIAWDDAMFRDELRRLKEEDLNLTEAEIPLHAKHMLSRKRRHMRKTRSSGNHVQLARPYISTDHSGPASLAKALRKLVKRYSPIPCNTPGGVLQGAKLKITHEEAVEFLNTILLNHDDDRGAKSDLARRIAVIGKKVQDSPSVNLVIRNGSGTEMGEEIPEELRSLGLKRVIRASRDGIKVNQLISGVTQGRSILTSDWFCDGFVPKGPTSRSRGWRSIHDPILLIVYIIDEHHDHPLAGSGPWVCIAANMPHGGPGGAAIANKHRKENKEGDA